MSIRITRGQDVHPGTVWIWREPNAMWSQETCSFCGSIQLPVAAEFLEAGNDASGTEWKYGWPHKFYVTDNDGKQWKFYSEHLSELGPETFKRVTDAIASSLKIRFEYDLVDRLFIRAPSYGFQISRRNGVETSQMSDVYEWEVQLNEEILGKAESDAQEI